MTIPLPLSDKRLSSTDRVLLSLLRHGRAGMAVLTALPPEGWTAVTQLAELHGVAPLLHRALQNEPAGTAPESIRTRLGEERRATALDNLRNYSQFRRIVIALRAAGVPVMALKGLHLAELVYRDISLRPMSDMDILVPRGQLQLAVAVLRKLDYGFDEDLSHAAGAMLDTKCNIGLSHRRIDVWLEVHWSLDEPPGRRAAAVDAIWRGAVAGRLGDADTLLMSSEFLLLHVCAHLACSHAFAFSLRGLCDIAEIVRGTPEIDWEVVIAHGGRHGWERGVAAALRLAAEHLGAAVPPEVLSALGADALSSERLEEAMEHLVGCVYMPEELRTAPNLIAAASSSDPSRSLRLLWKRIFVPRAELALLYGIPKRSARLPLFYFLRLGHLLSRYAASAWALKFSDPVLAAAAARHLRLVNWISGAKPAGSQDGKDGKDGKGA